MGRKPALVLAGVVAGAMALSGCQSCSTCGSGGGWGKSTTYGGHAAAAPAPGTPSVAARGMTSPPQGQTMPGKTVGQTVPATAVRSQPQQRITYEETTAPVTPTRATAEKPSYVPAMPEAPVAPPVTPPAPEPPSIPRQLQDAPMPNEPAPLPEGPLPPIPPPR